MYIAIDQNDFIMCEKHEFGGFTPHIFDSLEDFKGWHAQQPMPKPFMVQRRAAHGRLYPADDHRGDHFWFTPEDFNKVY